MTLMQRRRALMGVQGRGGGIPARGTIDYTLNGLASATYTSGYIYNLDTGLPEAKSGEYISSKVHLQNCMYKVGTGQYVRIYAWDANGNYAGCTPENGTYLYVFSARSDWTYAIKKYGTGSASLVPVNNSATMGATKQIKLTEITGTNGSGDGRAFYNNIMTSLFSGLISSSGNLLNFDAVDWIYGDNLIYLPTKNTANPTPKTACTTTMSVQITPSQSNVELWVYTRMYSTNTAMNTYLASNPISLYFNLP